LRSAVSGYKEQQHRWSETKSDRPGFNIQAWLKVLYSGQISIKLELKLIHVFNSKEIGGTDSMILEVFSNLNDSMSKEEHSGQD